MTNSKNVVANFFLGSKDHTLAGLGLGIPEFLYGLYLLKQILT